MFIEPARLQRVIPISGLVRVFRPAHQRVLGNPGVGVAITYAAAVRSDTTDNDQWADRVALGRVSDRAVGPVYRKTSFRLPRPRTAPVAEVDMITQRYLHRRRSTCSRTTPSNRADSSSAAKSSFVNRWTLSAVGSPSSSAAGAPAYRPGVSV